MLSVWLKAKGTVHEHSTLVDEVGSYGVWVNNSETIIDIVIEQLSKWKGMVGMSFVAARVEVTWKHEEEARMTHVVVD